MENALYHGIKNKRGGGKITVEGHLVDGADSTSNSTSNKEIIFSVHDSGIGMNEEELTRLRDLISGKIVLDEQRGFGMANVEKRIEMMYGSGYGLSVDSEYEEGTTVIVRIPAS